MPEILIRSTNVDALKKLADLVRVFGFEVITSADTTPTKNLSHLPITFAKKPNVLALAGIWKDKNITLEQLRKDAWGDRL